MSILTREVAEEAIGLVAPAIEAYFRGPNAARPALAVVVGVKNAGTSGGGVFLAEYNFGEPSTWEKRYDHFAKAKARICLRTGLNSDEAVRNEPFALDPGDITYRGGIVIGSGDIKIVVACSGLASRDDEMFAYMIGHAIIAILRRQVEAVTATDEAYLPQ